MVMTKQQATTSISLADMGRKEAEEVTQAIKDNFDSLGAMLLQARDRKAYKALGYRSFESYCKTEFGRSISSAYQLIEDAKVVSQLEQRISQNYGEEITLNLPSSHLKPLKEIADIDDKLKVIECAQKLAKAENRKTTKKDLEIAVFQISGKRSEDFKNAIESRGFVKGTPVEVQSPLKKDRGVVTRVDKSGKIYVELYYHSAKAMPFNSEELRILLPKEKPTNPLEGSIASKGDRVLIYAAGLEGREGEIYTWSEGKQALVMVDGQNSPTPIAYAEMELIKKPKHNNAWDSELMWESGKNTYYYFPQEDSISSNRWPTGLTLKPYTHSGTPIEFVQNWEDRFSARVIESLATPASIKTLALAQAVEEGKEFAADLVSSLLELFPDIAPEPLSQKSLGISFAKTINELVSGKKTQTRRAWQDDYAKNFIRYFEEDIAIPALDKGRHRGGNQLGFIKLTKRPYQQYLSEMSAADLQEEGGMVSTVQEFIDTFFEGQDKLVWVIHFEFLSTPTLIEENQRLREQLAEAEAAIQAMVNAASTSGTMEFPEIAEVLVENTPETLAPTPTTVFLDDWKLILKDNKFTRNYHSTNDSTEEYRGWKIYLDPNGGFQYIDLNHPEKGAFCCDIQSLDTKLDDENEDAIIAWAKAIINQIEDFCPGQLTFDFSEKIEAVECFPTKLITEIELSKTRKQIRIESIEHQLKTESHTIKKDKKLRSELRWLKESLQNLEDVQKLRIGQIVRHKSRPEITGKIAAFTLSQGGMPEVLVQWPNQTDEIFGTGYIPEKVQFLLAED
jgi:hypothetical protein